MIKEVIVVEGRADTVAVKRAVEADTIETGGSAISEETIEKIRLAQQKRGVIIFTDPDYQGERIRRIVSEAVPGCKHAFITQEEGTKKGDIGVENAPPEVIRKALSAAKTESPAVVSDIAWEDLLAAGLVGGPGASERRLQLGKKLGIGYGNAKQFFKRLQIFRIGKAEFLAALAALGREEHSR
ncbi:ribonuclease M5 [Bacillaceae bacterium]